MRSRSILRTSKWAGILLLGGTALCAAQSAPSPSAAAHKPIAHAPFEKPAIHPTAKEDVPAAAQPQSNEPHSLLQLPPQPAVITLADGKLAVKADNSSLAQIVNQLGKESGMSISGLTQDQRVFGVYGPGNPSQILSELLEGAGYNVLMTGLTAKGTPRTLSLSIEGNAPPSPPQSFPQQQNYAPQPFYQRQPIPPAAPRGNLNFPVRSPAQMEQMRQQQQQQQQPH